MAGSLSLSNHIAAFLPPRPVAMASVLIPLHVLKAPLSEHPKTLAPVLPCLSGYFDYQSMGPILKQAEPCQSWIYASQSLAPDSKGVRHSASLGKLL